MLKLQVIAVDRMQDLLRALRSQVANKSNAIRKNNLPWQVLD